MGVNPVHCESNTALVKHSLESTGGNLEQKYYFEPGKMLFW